MTIQQTVRRVAAKSPRLYCAVARAKRGRNRLVVDRNTDLLVEGHPRSGNTYAVAWLASTWPELAVASHVHHPAHVARALDLGIPSLVIVRPPRETVLSMLVYSSSDDVEGALQRWLRYYRSAAIRDHRVHVETFQAVKDSMPGVIERLSQCTKFSPPPHPAAWPSDDNVFGLVTDLGNRRFGAIPEEKLSIPSDARSAAREELEPMFARPDARTLLDHANEVYRELEAR